MITILIQIQATSTKRSFPQLPKMALVFCLTVCRCYKKNLLKKHWFLFYETLRQYLYNITKFLICDLILKKTVTDMIILGANGQVSPFKIVSTKRKVVRCPKHTKKVPSRPTLITKPTRNCFLFSPLVGLSSENQKPLRYLTLVDLLFFLAFIHPTGI